LDLDGPYLLASYTYKCTSCGKKSLCSDPCALAHLGYDRACTYDFILTHRLGVSRHLVTSLLWSITSGMSFSGVYRYFFFFFCFCRISLPFNPSSFIPLQDIEAQSQRCTMRPTTSNDVPILDIVHAVSNVIVRIATKTTYFHVYNGFLRSLNSNHFIRSGPVGSMATTVSFHHDSIYETCSWHQHRVTHIFLTI
jgi:hypothetical protein